MRLLSGVSLTLHPVCTAVVRSTVHAVCPAIAKRAVLAAYRGSARTFLAVLALSSALLALSPAVLPAQERQELPELEEVIVTAGFRDRGLMTSPGSVTVVDAETARDRAAQHLESVLNAAPNISYSSGGSRARFVQVRGIGDLEQFLDPKHFPSVGVSFDDIHLGGTANAGMLFDTEQVEILRGPQGTRFGTSALAGLVNIRGNRPTDEFMSYVEAGAGNYGAWNLGAVVSGPLGDAAGARFAVQKNRGDGYIDNAALARSDTNGYDETTARGTLEFEPNDRATYGLTAFYFDGRNGYDAFSLDNTRTTFADEPGRDDQQSTALAGRAEWLIGEAATLSAVATWLDSDLAYGFDEDWTFDGICDGLSCVPYSGTDEYLRDRSEVSFDLRLLGEARPGAAASIEYVVGAYAQRRDEDLHRRYYGDFFSAYETDREALYGQIDIAPGARLSLTAGLRYERFSDGYDDTGGFASASDDTLKSGELTLAFDASPDTTLYATVSRGNKAGGVNTAASANFPFMQPRFQAFMHGRLLVGKETLLNTEVGLKGRYLDGRLALRASLFDMDRDNAQLESWMWDAVGFLWIGFLDNVDGGNQGAELELEFDVSARARLFASIGWLDTDIERIETYDLDLGDFVVRTDIDQAKSPEFQFNLGASISFSDRWRARVELEGRDDSRFGYYHERTLPSHTLLNASVRASFGPTELQLWGRNLADTDYAVHGLYFGNDPRKGWINESYFQYGEPRVVGVTVRHSF